MSWKGGYFQKLSYQSINAAKEYLAEQYDREIKEFYLEGQEQARVKREGVQHGQLKEYNQPDVWDLTDLTHIVKRKYIPVIMGN